MDTHDLYEKGLRLRRDMLGTEAVDARMHALGPFGAPLQEIINAYAYGDVWSRSALPAVTKSLVMVGMMAAAGHPNELGVHALPGTVLPRVADEDVVDTTIRLAVEGRELVAVVP